MICAVLCTCRSPDRPNVVIFHLRLMVAFHPKGVLTDLDRLVDIRCEYQYTHPIAVDDANTIPEKLLSLTTDITPVEATLGDGDSSKEDNDVNFATDSASQHTVDFSTFTPEFECTYKASVEMCIGEHRQRLLVQIYENTTDSDASPLVLGAIGDAITHRWQCRVLNIPRDDAASKGRASGAKVVNQHRFCTVLTSCDLLGEVQGRDKESRYALIDHVG